MTRSPDEAAISSQAAIVKGAALRGLEGLKPKRTRLRQHYGFIWSIPFRPGIDAESNSMIDSFDNIKWVNGIMSWRAEKVRIE